MPKQKIIIIIGVVLALMAVVMTKSYLDDQRQIVNEEAKKKIASIQANIPKSQAQVLVATKDIPNGAIIDSDSAEISVVPEQYRQPQAVSSLDRILGMMTVAPIAKNEQITLTKLAQPRQSGGLAEGTPVGKRAITISVDNIASVGGMIKPGDYVDIISLVPVPTQTPDGKQVNQVAVMPLFQNVLVLAVGQDIGMVRRPSAGGRYVQEEGKKEGVSPLITVALSPQESNLIAFVQEQGKIRFTLRSPADSRIESTQPASWDTLFRYVMPQQEQSNRTSVKEITSDSVKPEYVEIYRGLNKEKVLLSK